MSIAEIVLGLFVACVAIALLKGIYIVHPEQRALVERMGRFVRVADPGPHWRLVLFDKRNVVNLSMRYATCEVMARTLGDGAKVKVDLAIQFCVDPAQVYNAHYKLSEPKVQLEAQATEIVLRLLTAMDFDDALKASEEIGAALKGELAAYATQYGYLIKHVIVKALNPEPSVMDAMSRKAVLERTTELEAAQAAANNARALEAAETAAQVAGLKAAADAASLKAVGEAVLAMAKSFMADDDKLNWRKALDKAIEVLQTTGFEKFAKSNATVILGNAKATVGLPARADAVS